MPVLGDFWIVRKMIKNRSFLTKLYKNNKKYIKIIKLIIYKSIKILKISNLEVKNWANFNPFKTSSKQVLKNN